MWASAHAHKIYIPVSMVTPVDTPILRKLLSQIIEVLLSVLDRFERTGSVCRNQATLVFTNMMNIY